MSLDHRLVGVAGEPPERSWDKLWRSLELIAAQFSPDGAPGQH